MLRKRRRKPAAPRNERARIAKVAHAILRAKYGVSARFVAVLLTALAIANAWIASPAAQSRTDTSSGIASEVAHINAARSTFQKRERILTGTSAEGTSVEAYLESGRYREIVVEELGETSRTMSFFYFDPSSNLIRARVRLVGYKTYPRYDPSDVTPHKHLIVDPTDKLLADDTYDFAGGRLVRWASFGHIKSPSAPQHAQRQAAVAKDAQFYVDFMDTPPAAGEDESAAWTCVRGSDDRCERFEQEP